MDIKEIVENAMSEAESKYPPSDIENALENVLKRAEKRCQILLQYPGTLV